MDALFKTQAYRIFELFIEHPDTDFSARGIARKLHISHATALKYLRELERLGLIEKNKRTLYPTYRAETMGEKYQSYKRERIVFLIRESGLVGYIQERLLPSCIVLFGSCAKGAYREDSDIDLFVEASESDLDLSAFEKKLRKGVHITYEFDINTLSPELKDNIINGVVLYGAIRIRERSDDAETGGVAGLHRKGDHHPGASRREKSHQNAPDS